VGRAVEWQEKLEPAGNGPLQVQLWSKDDATTHWRPDMLFHRPHVFADLQGAKQQHAARNGQGSRRWRGGQRAHTQQSRLPYLSHKV
jgi:hypothetical protein